MCQQVFSCSWQSTKYTQATLVELEICCHCSEQTKNCHDKSLWLGAGVTSQQALIEYKCDSIFATCIEGGINESWKM